MGRKNIDRYYISILVVIGTASLIVLFEKAIGDNIGYLPAIFSAFTAMFLILAIQKRNLDLSSQEHTTIARIIQGEIKSNGSDNSVLSMVAQLKESLDLKIEENKELLQREKKKFGAECLQLKSGGDGNGAS